MLEPLSSFILPGGVGGGAALHLARAIVRRAERAAVALDASEPLNPLALAYLNRLSDHLFVARALGRARTRAATCCGNRARPAATERDITTFVTLVSWQEARDGDTGPAAAPEASARACRDAR